MTSMTDRELPTIAGAIACPFVAFEGGRDSRATSPDHRHRCYAEVRPTPRALAHQQAYCLSSAFAVCPTFQDWARREAAQAQPAPELAPQIPTVHGVAPTDSSVSQANAGAAGNTETRAATGHLRRHGWARRHGVRMSWTIMPTIGRMRSRYCRGKVDFRDPSPTESWPGHRLPGRLQEPCLPGRPRLTRSRRLRLK